VLNPLKEDLEESSIDLLLSGTSDKKVVMIEMDGKQVELDTFMQCVEKGFEEIDTILAAIDEISRKAGKSKTIVSFSCVGLKLI
jgi:polyribonucleotide nucleotidyltransferase